MCLAMLFYCNYLQIIYISCLSLVGLFHSLARLQLLSIGATTNIILSTHAQQINWLLGGASSKQATSGSQRGRILSMLMLAEKLKR